MQMRQSGFKTLMMQGLGHKILAILDSTGR